MAEALFKELDDLELEAQRILTVRGRWIKEVKKLAEEKKAWRLRMVDLFKKAKDERGRRDEVNRKVAELKSSRELLKEELRGRYEEVKRLKGLLLKLKSQVKESREELAKKLEELEWMYQTHSLNIAQEKLIVDKIEQVRGKLQVAMEAEGVVKKIRVVEGEIRKVKESIEGINSEIIKLAEESREHHNKYLSLIKEAEGLKEEVNKAHQQLMQAKSKADECHEQYLKIAVKIRKVEKRLRELISSEHAERILKLIKLREEEAKKSYEKLKKGKRISFEEFKALIEKELV